MSETITFEPASAFSLDALADIFTRSFENYFYPGATTGAALAQRVRAEQIDLRHSLVLRADEQPAGIALLALRADHAWCGGFGIVLAYRGRGLAHNLAAAMLGQARQAGARACSLEVLTRNQPAFKTYLRAGFQARRDLQIFDWRRPEDYQAARTERQESAHQAQLIEAAPGWLLEHFAALHPAPAAWQRDLPALLVRGGLSGLALMEQEQPRAYALISSAADGAARIEDLGAQDARLATTLIGLLQARYTRLISINEPADSAITPAYAAAGFSEADRQHELWIDLSSIP
jgi:GNAT superfamily N-acetyltransferase